MTMESQRRLREGQVWATQAASIEIVALGKSLIHYRVMNQIGEKRVSAQISGIAPMEKYLQTNAARLIRRAYPG